MFSLATGSTVTMVAASFQFWYVFVHKDDSVLVRIERHFHFVGCKEMDTRTCECASAPAQVLNTDTLLTHRQDP